MGYLADCYRALGFSREDSEQRAKLAYTTYVGFIHLNREAREAEPVQPEYVKHVLEALVPGLSDHPGGRETVSRVAARVAAR